MSLIIFWVWIHARKSPYLKIIIIIRFFSQSNNSMYLRDEWVNYMCLTIITSKGIRAIISEELRDEIVALKNNKLKLLIFHRYWLIKISNMTKN